MTTFQTMQRKNGFLILLLLIVVVFQIIGLKPAVALTEQVEKQYLSIITSGSVEAKILVAKKITRSYIANKKIFSALEKQILENFKRYDRDSDQLAWFCKALASSGNKKYLNTLQQVAKESDDAPNLQYFARCGIQSIDFHKKRNRILARSGEYQARGFDRNNALLAAMLQSEEIILQRDAARQITEQAVTIDPRLYEMIKYDLLRGLKKNDNDHLFIDTLAWLCKALASSGNKKYRKTLEQVIKNTDNPKLESRARRSIKNIAVYQKRKRILSRSQNFLAQGFDQNNAHLAAMLDSENFVLQRNASIKIYQNLLTGTSVDPRLFDIIETKLSQGLGKEPEAAMQNQAKKWMCKALAATNNNRYDDLLRQVMSEIDNPRLYEW